MAAKGWKEVVWADLAADLRRRWRFSLVNVPMPTSTRAFETASGPLGPEGRSLMESTPFGGFSASLRRTNQLATVAEFWFSADWLPFSPDLNSLDFSTGSVLQPKSQARPHADLPALCPSVAAEWDQLAAVQIRKTCRSFRCCR
jgi:hypothetical protein